jgi:hypothetical protein
MDFVHENILSYTAATSSLYDGLLEVFDVETEKV